MTLIDNLKLTNWQTSILNLHKKNVINPPNIRKEIRDFVTETAFTDSQKEEMKLFLHLHNKTSWELFRFKINFNNITKILNSGGNLDPDDRLLSQSVAVLRIENLLDSKAGYIDTPNCLLAITEEGRVFGLDPTNSETLIGKGKTKEFIQAFDYETLEEVTYSAVKYINKETINRIRQEYLMLKKLSFSPYFPKVHCQIETASKIIVIQTLYEPFSKAVFDGLSSEMKLHIYKGLLKAVSILEDNKIVHRDIKPDNVLLRRRKENGQIVIDGILADFDLAIYAEKLTAELAKAAERVAMGKHVHYRPAGTPYYMSPECFEPKAPALVLPFKLDPWAVGITGYEMLVKKTEYQKTARTLSKLTTYMNKILTRTSTGEVIYDKHWLKRDWLTTQNSPPDIAFSRSSLFYVLKHLCNPDPQERMSAKKALKRLNRPHTS